VIHAAHGQGVRSWDIDQGWLLPPSLHELVPPGHMAYFVRDTVREALDPSGILDTWTEERGYPPYHSKMIVALLLYGYSRVLYSSLQLARAREERNYGFGAGGFFPSNLQCVVGGVPQIRLILLSFFTQPVMDR